MFTIYSLTLIMGLSAIVSPPQSVEGAIGHTLTYVWGGLLVVSGTFGASGVVPGLWWAERVAVRAGITGASIYAAVLIYLQSHSDGLPGTNRIPAACAVLIVVVLFLGRSYKIRGINYEPRPERG